MTLRPPHITLRDETLPHQAVIYKKADETSVYISCNCRVVGKVVRGRTTYSPIGVTEDIADSRRLYNDPKNHNLPFGPEDVAKW